MFYENNLKMINPKLFQTNKKDVPASSEPTSDELGLESSSAFRCRNVSQMWNVIMWEVRIRALCAHVAPVNTPTDGQVEAKEWPQVSSSITSTLFLTDWLDCLVSGPLRPTCLFFQVLGWQPCMASTQLLFGFWRPRLRYLCLWRKHSTHWIISPAWVRALKKHTKEKKSSEDDSDGPF